ncbi:DUF1643 domain-containing protein [Natrialbaceae archaeon AArc-T1-2]|uniref:DUF1643 domain-containing protein n=1 Tax=Natrialbaceae archaeon AArc-T1-2 TaxID=3053904 RepID=UPI00255B21F8|nr:DUF1643 domain-containing protein [Natrialbaceae archaeon AArc-T1-2]WIV68384.1 DUF1643 domain-containing protein [Natrialbaceae archaeon AArc-T1-2]
MNVRETPGPDPAKPEYTDATAVISDDGEYRYRLSRTWDEERPVLAFLMVNPSSADGDNDDRTITRCVKYANGMGFGKLVVANLFAVRSSDPAAIDTHPEPIGPENERYLRATCDKADRVIAGWGRHGAKRGRGRDVATAVDVELYALDTTAAGHPCHPGRMPYDTTIERFEYDQ